MFAGCTRKESGVDFKNSMNNEPDSIQIRVREAGESRIKVIVLAEDIASEMDAITELLLSARPDTGLSDPGTENVFEVSLRYNTAEIHILGWIDGKLTIHVNDSQWIMSLQSTPEDFQRILDLWESLDCPVID
jgi:hypothetical protein